MPIYEYECLECNKRFETLVLGGNDNVSCPDCKGKRLERLISTFGFKSSGNSAPSSAPSASSSGCASCSGTNCSSCG